jgi:hypothetical protein
MPQRPPNRDWPVALPPLELELPTIDERLRLPGDFGRRPDEQVNRCPVGPMDLEHTTHCRTELLRVQQGRQNRLVEVVQQPIQLPRLQPRVGRELLIESLVILVSSE